MYDHVGHKHPHGQILKLRKLVHALHPEVNWMKCCFVILAVIDTYLQPVTCWPLNNGSFCCILADPAESHVKR